jgi:hypothetical protein
VSVEEPFVLKGSFLFFDPDFAKNGCTQSTTKDKLDHAHIITFLSLKQPTKGFTSLYKQIVFVRLLKQGHNPPRRCKNINFFLFPEKYH